MIKLKTKQEIEIMREGGELLSRALKAVIIKAKPGVLISDLDKIAEKVLIDGGGAPAFKGFKSRRGEAPFPSTVCISINDEVVHGLGDRSIHLKEGDIVGFDSGCLYDGLYTDMSVTVGIGKISDEDKNLIERTKKMLLSAVKAAKVGGTIADIGKAIENKAREYNYGVVRDLVGHGVGHAVHEDPVIPNFYVPANEKVKIVSGMCLAIEPMITAGGWKVRTAPDGWTVKTQDGSRCAHFEVTIAVTDDKTEILTPFPI